MFNEVVDFWFEELTPEQWWIKDAELDSTIEQRFSELHKAANACELSHWRKTATGRLAEIIILDQFSRHLYRDDPRAYASDTLALALAQSAIEVGADQELCAAKRNFIYMPFMHSESILIHKQALRLFTDNGIESNLEYELQHKKIIDQFGRYPHRNAVLSRPSTDEELAFLQQPGSSF